MSKLIPPLVQRASLLCGVTCIAFSTACGSGDDDASPAARVPNQTGGSSNLGGDSGTGGTSAGTSSGGSSGTEQGGTSSGSGGTSSGSGATGGPDTTMGLGKAACDLPPATCKHNTKLPSGAPKLSTTEWTNISPPDSPFHGPDPIFTQGMTIDPCDSSVLYFTIDGFEPEKVNAGLYKSTDAGAHWNRVGNLDEPIRIRVDPKNPMHLYAVDGVRGGTEGFWVSCDGGDSFYQPDAFKALIDDKNLFQWDGYDLAVDPKDFDHLLMSFHARWGDENSEWKGSSGVLESKDGGANWIIHPPGDGWGSGHAINFLYNPDQGIGDANTWLLGTQGPGMFRTTDAGKTWTKVTDNAIQHGGGNVYYDKAGLLYVTTSYNILQSADNGETFTPLMVPNGGYSDIIGDGNLLYISRNGDGNQYQTAAEGDGSVWTNLSDQTFNSGPFEMAYDPDNRILYSAAWTEGIWAIQIPE